MRGLVILVTLCGVVFGRAQISGEQQNVEEEINPVEIIDDSQFTKESEATTEAVYSERKAKYRFLPDQYNEESSPVGVSRTCREKNERYSIPGSCDRYIECLVSLMPLITSSTKSLVRVSTRLL
ncbi:unnamed protein product [Danaus chrysippus]|uniref:(African queen) hypothetical protein n=1 Tax=Danaus chrysippus TaxID=151541 RepID=A0A8J2VUN9_9NEOP|nr:unnamed protein product [Danaus chrysippus]